MSTLRIDSNECFSTEVTIRESDPYTKSVYVKFDRYYIPEEIRGCNEMFVTPSELERLARFMLRQADEIRTEQAVRKETA